jgi:two-component system, LytTR family, sensor kinase
MTMEDRDLLENDAAPRLKAGIVVASILGFWLFYVVIVTLRASVLDFPAQAELAQRRAVVTAVGIAITGLLWLVLRTADRKPLGVRILATLVAALPCAVAIATTNYYVFNVYDAASIFDEMQRQKMEAPGHMYQEIAEVSISRYFFLVAWAALYLAMTYANDVRHSERIAAQYAKAAQEAELRALRYQVNPHFLFNTLNALSSLVMSGRNAEAEKMIMNLSTYFRSSLSDDPSADVSLRDEVALQRLYLDMESTRFRHRLSVRTDIPDTLSGAAVPGLILQPLVENAIKHGVARTSAPVTVSIAAREDNGHLVIDVENDGPGGDSPTAASSGHGIGLANVRDRLAARFGKAASAAARVRAGGGFIVSLTMPLVAYDG